MPPLLLTAAAAVLLAQTAETITVTATRTEARVADTPSSVVVLSRETLENAPAPTLDDALRQVAGFTLFRRTGSRVANPTSQGVTLRGVGASGASRALVLDDGVPLNDPFGGWVYWGRVPRVALERVEVLRGGASDLYGSSAMGGVIQFIRRKSAGITADVSAGSDDTANASVFAAGEHGSVSLDFLNTGGYVLVRPGERGAVDVAADSRHLALDATLRRDTLFVRASHYSESRHNGTPLQENDTELLHLALGGDVKLFEGVLALRAFGSDQDYYQTFSAIETDRSSERLTVEQRVPSRGAGGSTQWTRAYGGRHVVVAGTDVRYASGTSDELRFTAAGTFRVQAGGTQRTAAAYLEDLFAVTPALAITAGIRGDWWRSDDGSEGQVNPRVSVLWRANDALSFAASAYTAFRAPTLNELYRGFRVGNVNTLPNPELLSEDLTGFELGARTRNVRLTLFWMDVTDAIANVTVSVTPTLITRRRENLGTTRSRGAELDADWSLGKDWRASAGLLFVDAVVRNGELRGRRVPQVPRFQSSAQVWRTGNPACPDRQDCLSSTTIGAQVRWSAMQFDDDRNELPLDAYLVADLFASHPLRHGVDLTVAVENVFDEAIEAGATPVVTLGQPRAWRLGLRYSR